MMFVQNTHAYWVWHWQNNRHANNAGRCFSSRASATVTGETVVLQSTGAGSGAITGVELAAAIFGAAEARTKKTFRKTV